MAFNDDNEEFMRAQPVRLSGRSNRPPPKSSSERGRQFRARQQQREATVQREVDALRNEVRALTASRSLFYERLLKTPSAPDGSIQRKIREFFALCEDGLEARVHGAVGDRQLEQKAERVRVKENYMRSVFDPDTVTGELYGVHTVIEQWRRYTVFHGRFHLNPGRIDVIGPDDDREFHLHVKLTVRVTRNTFEHIFPVALSDEVLVQKLLNREVQYDCVVRMRFSEAGRITAYFLDVDFIGGLRSVCDNLEDVAKLLNQSKITPTCMLRDPMIDRPGRKSPVIDFPATLIHPDEHQQRRAERNARELHDTDGRNEHSSSHDQFSPIPVTLVDHDEPMWQAYDLTDRLVKPASTAARQKGKAKELW